MIDSFERGLREALEDHARQEEELPTRHRRKHAPAVNQQSIVVTLAVRERQLATDYQFVYECDSTLSRTQAIIEAERAARDAGWPIIGYVFTITIKHR